MTTYDYLCHLMTIHGPSFSYMPFYKPDLPDHVHRQDTRRDLTAQAGPISLLPNRSPRARLTER